MNADGSLGFVQTAALFALRCGATSQGNARAIVLDLSEGEPWRTAGWKCWPLRTNGLVIMH
jgi:hypothetical protein